MELGTLLAALGQNEEAEVLREDVLSALEKTGISPPEAIGFFMKAMSNISFMMNGIDGKVIPGRKLGKQKSRGVVSNVVPMFSADKSSSKRVSESVVDQSTAAYQLKIVLKRVTPAIWRRVVVPLDCSLEELHDIIQTAMGWFDSHLYEFRIGRLTFSKDPEFTNVKESREYTLRNFDFGINSTFEYLYDFGDDWLHSVKVEKVLSEAEYDESEIFIKGKGACPPEDCGGPYGFMAYLSALKSPGFDMSMFPEMFHDFDPLLLPECFYEKKKSSKRNK
ncbi:MAG: plasmid pRiA4b ORF-3 family protein [Leptolyngbya sp.]|nr:plasmid pRiA4b ORF-3 family protein [Candidatus Melainabacteria bacterium]